MIKNFLLASVLLFATNFKGYADSPTLKGYVGLGLTEGGIEGYCKDLYAYNPKTDSWEKKADFPAAPRHRAVAFQSKNKGYVGFGLTPGYWDKAKRQRIYGSYKKDFYQYNPATNKWKLYTVFKGHRRSRAVAVTINKKAYVGFGDNGAGGGYYSDIHSFDVSNKKWEALPVFPKVNSAKHVFSVNYKLYVLANACLDHEASIYCYYKKEKKWKVVTKLPNVDHMPDCVFVIKNKLYAGLGRLFTKDNPDGFRNMTQLFYTYDFVRNKWDKIAPFPGDTRNDVAVFVIGNKAHIGLGYTESRKYTSAFYQYDPVTNKWLKIADFPGKNRGGSITFICP